MEMIMSVNIAIIIEKGHDDEKVIERSYVRQLEGDKVPNTKDMDSMLEWVLYFLDMDELCTSFDVDVFSPMGKYMKISFNGETIDNTILVIWEHIES